MKPTSSKPTVQSLTARNAELIAALREARDFINALLDSTDPTNLLVNSGEDVTDRLNGALGQDAFDIGDDVLAESFELGLSEYQGVIVEKRLETDGSALFTVEDQDGDGNDHEAHEIRLVD